MNLTIIPNTISMILIAKWRPSLKCDMLLHKCDLAWHFTPSAFRSNDVQQELLRFNNILN